MVQLLEKQVIPELSRLERIVKKRDKWAKMIAENEIHVARVQEEAELTMRKLQTELSELDSIIEDI